MDREKFDTKWLADHEPLPGMDTPCWMWLRGKQVRCGGKKTSPQRAAYALHVGPIPRGAYIRRLCPPYWTCVNPEHLELLGATEHRGNPASPEITLGPEPSGRLQR